jgi:hypothetical protein
MAEAHLTSSLLLMQPALSDKELARRYAHLTPEQRLEMERWHRGRNEDRMFGRPIDETEQPPFPEYPPGSLVDQAFALARTDHFDPEVVKGLRRLYDLSADNLEDQFVIGHMIESQIVMASEPEDFAVIDDYWHGDNEEEEDSE